MGEVFFSLVSAGLECKTASAYNADKWKDGKVPMHYILQAAHYMAVTGRKAWYPEELEEVLSQCYTGHDFIDECSGDVEKAKRLFYYCDWQHPSSAMDELADDEGEP